VKDGRLEVNNVAETTSVTRPNTPLGSSSPKVFVGIDVGYKTHVVCACPGSLFNAKRYPDGWKRAKTLPFTSDASGFKKLQKYLDSFSTNPSDFLMLCEPTGGYYSLALQMYLLGKKYCLLQVDNTAVKEYRQNIYGSETKTDAMDARLMARMGFLHEWVGEEFSIQAVHLASPDESVLRLMSRDLTKLTKDITRRRSQLHQILAFTFPEFKTFFKASVTGSAARNLLKKYPAPNDLKNAPVQDIALVLQESHAYRHIKKAGELLTLAQNTVGIQLVSHHTWRQAWILHQLDGLEEARKEVVTQLYQITASHPYTPIIESLPIKSPTWTATLISVIGNVERFHNYAQFRAYMGWFPKVAQSGTSLNASRLADDGVRLGRNVLGRMALTFLAPRVRETPFRIYHERLVARGMKPSVALGHMAGKLASVLYECLKTHTFYDETKHRKQMGLPVGDDTTAGVVIEVPDAEIDTPEVSSEPPSLP